MEKKILSLSLVLLFGIFLISTISATTTSTASTDTTCNGNICTQTLYSGIVNVYEDDVWKPVAEARSLLGSGIVPVVIEDDKDFPVEVIDYNATSIKVRLNPKGVKIFTEDIPLRIWNEDDVKALQFSKDLADGKVISKGVEDYKSTMDKVEEEFIKYNLINQEEIKTYDFTLGSILEFGYNSTTIILDDNTTEVLDDANTNEFNPDSNYGSIGWVDINIPDSGNSQQNGYYKFNITSIPSGQAIINATLVLFASPTNTLDDGTEGWNISVIHVYEEWEESTLTWNNQPSGVGINSTAEFTRLYDGDSNKAVGLELFPVTNAVKSAYNTSSLNVTIGLIPHDVFGTPGSIDYVRFYSKDYTTNITKRPYLEITYQLPVPEINVTYPLNTTYLTLVTSLNWTIGGIYESNCWYSNDIGVTNTSVTCGDLTTAITPAQGSNQYFMWANDSDGLEATSNVTFYYDTLNINITSPISGTNAVGFDTFTWTSGIGNSYCWYSLDSGTNTSVTCGDLSVAMPTISNGTHTLNLWANDSLGTEENSSITFSRTIFNTNSQTANTTTYETSRESFSINVSFDSSEFSTSSATLNYNGTAYTSTKSGSGDNYTFTKAFDIPLVTYSGNRSYFWNVTLNNGTNNYFYSPVKNISVTNITLKECSAGETIFLNYTFKDTDTGLYITASVPSSTFDFYIGGGDVKDILTFNSSSESSGYTFCGSPNATFHNEITFNFEKSPGYTTHNQQSTTDISNTTTNTILFMTGTSNGAFITFQLQDTGGGAVKGANLQVERKIGGVWNVIANSVSDDAGQGTFYLDITLDHRITITDDDYITEIYTIRPSQSVYTIILRSSEGIPAIYTSPLKGISYKITPKPGTPIAPNTMQLFTYNITANLSNLVSYTINITNSSGYQLNSSTGTTAGGSLISVYVNTSNHGTIYGYYYLNDGNGTHLIDPSIWSIMTILQSRGSIYHFFTTYTSTETNIEDNYSVLLLIFFLIFIGFGTLNTMTPVSFELQQPGIGLFIVFFLTAILSITGFLTMDFVENQFINKYGILLIVFFLTGGFTIGQWSKT